MATKIKGIFKGIKLISQIFVYKDHEMEIGYPTDVRHVAHIGWDGTSVNAPAWMNEFESASDVSTTQLSNFNQSRDLNSVGTSWSSQDCPNEITKVPKKKRRKKGKDSCPPPSSRSSRRSSKSKTSFAADESAGIENPFAII